MSTSGVVASVVTSLGWTILAAYAVWRADLLLGRWLALRNLQELNVAAATSERIAADERVAVRNADRDEHIATLAADARAEAGKRVKPSLKSIQLPDDLEAYVSSWNDEWARDDERNSLRAKYLDLHSGDTDATWQKVRRAVGIGEMPA